MAVTIRGGAAARLLTRRRFLSTAASTAALTIGGRHREAVDQPRGGSARRHARHPVRRRVDRFRRGLGARRPALPHAGRGRHHRQLQDHSQRGPGRRACRIGFHRQGAARRIAGRTGHLLSHPVRGSFVSDRHERARRSGASAPRRASGARSRSSGRATPPARAGASTRRAAACAPMPPCCATGPTSSSTRGDHIYGDCPVPAQRRLPNGEMWNNLVTEDKSRIARTLAEFRGHYKYNLLDRNVRAFNAEVPMFAQWDDHEVTNDWCPGEDRRGGAVRRRQHPPAHRARRPRLS